MSILTPSVKIQKVCSLLSPMVKSHHPLPHRLMDRESLQDPMTKRSYMEEGGGKKYLAIYDSFLANSHLLNRAVNQTLKESCLPSSDW